MASKGKKSRSKKRKKKGGRKTAPEAQSASATKRGRQSSKRSKKAKTDEVAAEPQMEVVDQGAPEADAEAAPPPVPVATGQADEAIDTHDLDEVLDEGASEVDALIAATSALGDDEEHDVGDASATEALDAPAAADAAPIPAPVDGDVEVDDLAVVADPGAPDPEPDEAVDLGETSTPEARARILAAALAHAERQEARYRIPTTTRTLARFKAVVALSIFAAAAVVAIAPPTMLVPPTPPGLADEERVRGLRLALLLQAEQVEAFRVREQRLPLSLDEVSGRVPGVRYVRSSNRLYQLVGYTPDGRAVVYDSAAPAPEFDALEPIWRGEARP